MQKDTPPVSVENCRILLVENDEADALRLGELLDQCKGDSHRGFEVAARVGQLQEVLTFLMAGSVDLVLLDLSMPGFAGIEAFLKLTTVSEDLPVIILTDLEGEELGLEAVRAGATDFLIKEELTQRSLQRAMHMAVERRKVERDFAREHGYLLTMMRSSPDCIYFKDVYSHFTYISHSLAKFFGMEKPEDAVGKGDFDIYSREHAEPRFRDEQLIMETGVPVLDKVEFDVLGCGKTRWVLTTKMPLYNSKGECIGTFGSSRDITEIKEMDQELSRERNLFRNTIDHLPDMIHAEDVEGRFILNNKAHVAALKAHSPHELLGKSASDFYPPELAEQYRETDRSVIDSQVPVIDLVEPCMGEDGLAHWIATTKVPLRDPNGEVSGVLTITRDITHLRAD